MNIRKKKPWDEPESKATPEAVFQARRRFVKALGLGSIAGAAGAVALQYATRAPIIPTEPISGFEIHPDFHHADRPLTLEEKVYRFNNFYEFAIDKTSPIRLCQDFRLEPWKLEVIGLVNKPQTFDLDDLRKMQLEQRVYRFRCVEAWAMTVPWIGIPLATLLEKAEPRSEAKYVAMISFYDPDQASRQKLDSQPWPYREAITINEAMNPLAFAAIGLYGKHLQPQNGAPFRVVLPWKYGFKGPKSVVRISLIARRPKTFWNTLQPHEYGFFGNVNPDLPHPRWSQRSEALLGTWGKRVSTQKFNGYGRWVADLYSGDEY